jgi:hypothetical protein
MTKDPMEIAFEKAGGIAAFVKWIKDSGRNRGDFYSWWAKRFNQSTVINNVAVANLAVADQSARRKLEDAFIRLIEARRASVGDPAVFVDGRRMRDDGSLIEHQPRSSDDPRPATDDAAVSPLNEGSSSWQKGPLLKPGGVATTPAETSPTGGQKTKMSYSNSTVPGLAAGAALDGLDDNLSTTQKFLNWRGHGRPP